LDADIILSLEILAIKSSKIIDLYEHLLGLKISGSIQFCLCEFNSSWGMALAENFDVFCGIDGGFVLQGAMTIRLC
jgi:hypothetical protein